MASEQKLTDEQVETLRKGVTFDDILARATITTREVPVVAWGAVITIQKLRKSRQDQIREACVVYDDKGKVVSSDRTRWQKEILMACVVDPPLTMEKVDALWDTDSAPLDKLLEAIFKFTGISEEAVEKAEAEFRQQS